MWNDTLLGKEYPIHLLREESLYIYNFDLNMKVHFKKGVFSGSYAPRSYEYCQSIYATCSLRDSQKKEILALLFRRVII